jgi:hypothetical protein
MRLKNVAAAAAGTSISLRSEQMLIMVDNEAYYSLPTSVVECDTFSSFV